MTSPTSPNAGQMLSNGHHGTLNVLLKNGSSHPQHNAHLHMDQLSNSDTTSNSGNHPPPLYHTLYNNFATWASNTGSATSTLPLGSAIGGKVTSTDGRNEDLLLMDSVSFYSDRVAGSENSPAWPPHDGSITIAHQPASGQYLGALTDANGTVLHHVMSSNALILPSSAVSTNSHVSTLSCLEPSTYLNNSLSLADPTQTTGYFSSEAATIVFQPSTSTSTITSSPNNHSSTATFSNTDSVRVLKSNHNSLVPIICILHTQTFKSPEPILSTPV